MAGGAGRLILPLADTTDDCLKVAGVWISSATIGAMIGTFAAVFSGRSLRTIELWTFWGTAMGTAFGARQLSFPTAAYRCDPLNRETHPRFVTLGRDQRRFQSR